MGGSYGGGEVEHDEGLARTCRDLHFTTMLSSPEPDAVAVLDIGQTLAVERADEAGEILVVVRLENGTIAGTITDELAELLPCLERGTRYCAQVITAEGGAVEVAVTAVDE